MIIGIDELFEYKNSLYLALANTELGRSGFAGLAREIFEWKAGAEDEYRKLILAQLDVDFTAAYIDYELQREEDEAKASGKPVQDYPF